MFKECFSLEKIHGSSAHISYKNGRVSFFAGGGKHTDFIKLFNAEKLKKKFEIIPEGKSVHVYGENYGGKMQGMSAVYGKEPKFVAFEVKIGDTWLNVPKAHAFVENLGLEFVHYVKIPTTLEAIDAERDAPSEQAKRNGMGIHHREGIVLRPLEEARLNSGERIIAKHKRPEYTETRTIRQISPEKLKVIEDARAIANEWVTYERLNHILTKGIVETTVENTGKVIALMTEDILREAKDEIIDSPDARKQMARLTALMFKDYIERDLRR